MDPKIIRLKTEQLLHNDTILSKFSSLKFTSWEGMRGGERGRGGGGERKLLTFTNNVFTIYNMGHAAMLC